MRRTLFFNLVFLFFISSLSAQQLQGDSWQKVKANKKGTLTCIYYKTPGLVFEEAGSMQGVCVDIMDEFKDFVKTKYQVDLQFNFQKRVNNFSSFIDQVKNGKDIMGVCNTSITASRKAYLSFSPAYMNNPTVLLSNNNAQKISSLDQMASSFAAYTAVIIKGSTHESYIQKIKSKYYPGLQVELVNSGPEVVAKLKSSKNYFTLIDFTEYFDAVKKRLSITRHSVDLDDLQDELAYIFPKGSDWQAVWEEFLSPEFKQSMTYKKIIADNLGSSFVNLIR